MAFPGAEYAHLSFLFDCISHSILKSQIEGYVILHQKGRHAVLSPYEGMLPVKPASAECIMEPA